MDPVTRILERLMVHLEVMKGYVPDTGIMIDEYVRRIVEEYGKVVQQLDQLDAVSRFYLESPSNSLINNSADSWAIKTASIFL